MTDFNQLLTPFSHDEVINTVVEIPEGSCLKIEYRRSSGTFELDRVEPSIFAKPTSYGFIPGTLDDDGDELDTLILASEPLVTGIYLKARVIAVLNFEDDGEIDHKIICVPEDDRDNGNRINTLEDLGIRWQQKIEFHFNHYKDLKKPGTTKVLGWGDSKEANTVIKDCIARYQTQNPK
jgi:inorganic pyrophosphatase